jgi:endonuclease/exonuclease/phosphatase family metal-dependent hydrolase
MQHASRVRLKLATYNVHNLGRADNSGEGVYASKLGFLTDVLRRVDADLVVIDEVREPESFAELADRLGYAGRCLADAPAETRRIQTGILTRLPLLEEGQWRDFEAAVPGHPGELTGFRFRRPLPYVRVELGNGEDLMVVAVHLKSRRADVELVPESEPSRKRRVLGRALSGVTRLLEAAGLRCQLDDAVARNAACHYAVLGDFNSPPGSMTVSLVSGIEDEDGSPLAESDERRLHPVSARIPPGQAWSYARRGQRSLLDHILVSQRLSLCLAAVGVENQLLAGATREYGEGGGYPRSDHAPLWAEFRLPPPAAEED